MNRRAHCLNARANCSSWYRAEARKVAGVARLLGRPGRGASRGVNSGVEQRRDQRGVHACDGFVGLWGAGDKQRLVEAALEDGVDLHVPPAAPQVLRGANRRCEQRRSCATEE